MTGDRRHDIIINAYKEELIYMNTTKKKIYIKKYIGLKCTYNNSF